MTTESETKSPYRLPPDLTPEARARFEEIAAMARTVTARLVGGKHEAYEPAGVFNLHTRKG